MRLGAWTTLVIFFMISLFTILMFGLLGTSGSCVAGETKGEEKAINETDDPLVFARLIQVKPEYTHIDDGGWNYTEVNRLLVPFDGTLVPGVRIGKTYSLVRLEAPFIYQNTHALTTWGTQDFILLDIVGVPTSFGAVGIGPLVSIPTASEHAFGSGKWSVGPAAGITVRSIQDTKLSVLFQQFFSIAGDSSRAPVSTLWVQPIFMRSFPSAYFVTIDPIFKFDWRNTTATLPVNLQLGKAFNQNLTASLGPEYDVAGPGTGNWLVKATVNYLNW